MVNFVGLTFLFLIVLGSIEIVTSTRILGLYLIGSKSHRGAFDDLFLGLAARGYDVTIVGYNFISGRQIPNLTEIDGPIEAGTMNFLPNPYETRLGKRSTGDVFGVLPALKRICTLFTEMPEVKALINQKFDLIIIDPAGNECIFGFLTHFNAPYIFTSPLPIIDFIIPELGIPTSLGTKPYMFSGIGNEMSLFDRIHNVFITTISRCLTLAYFASIENYYLKTFPNSSTVQDVYKKASLVFQNVHTSIDYPSLSVPGIVNTGGMHCRDGKQLPVELAEFLDEAELFGAIYFSLGSFIQGAEMPVWLRQHFVNAFGKLKQRVLWKYEHDTMGDVTLPPNVKIIKWAPQQDVLAHPNVKLLITQCGRLSVQEAIYHAVPVLGIPIFYDQYENIDRLVDLGLGLKLNLEDVTAETLLTSINKIMSTLTFGEKSIIKSMEFKNQPVKPLDLAIHWTEHVLHYGKNLDLFPMSRNYSVIRYYALDAICIILVSIILFVYLVCKLLKKLLSCCSSRNTQFSQQIPKLSKRD